MTFDALLLLALPASGKSEVRRYLDTADPGMRASDLHVAEPVHLDDYPYVHLMRRASVEAAALGGEPPFFADPSSPFLDPRDWLTLTHLLAEDWERLTRPAARIGDPGTWILDRFDAARRAAGAPPPISDPALRSAVARAIAADAADVADDAVRGRPLDLAGKTVVVEFARGGPDGAAPPLPAPLGYRASLACLPRPLLERAVALYVRATPEQSRRRNRERAHPGPEGDASILHHGVPDAVLRADYGMDDFAWLVEHGRRPGTITVRAARGIVDLPAGVFDNHDDLTSFLRDDRGSWGDADLERLHDRLRTVLDDLYLRR